MCQSSSISFKSTHSLLIYHQPPIAHCKQLILWTGTELLSRILPSLCFLIPLAFHTFVAQSTKLVAFVIKYNILPIRNKVRCFSHANSMYSAYSTKDVCRYREGLRALFASFTLEGCGEGCIEGLWNYPRLVAPGSDVWLEP